MNRFSITLAAFAVSAFAPIGGAHATQVTAYTATHDIACMTERANLSTKYPHTKAWGAAMANLTAFGDAHATEIRQGFEPRETCADAGDYAIALTLHGDAIPADKTPGGLPMCSAAFVDAYEANGSKAVMPAESCFMDTAVSGAKVCDSEKCVDTDEAGDDNAIGSFFATFRPHEEIAMGHGVTCTNPYAFDIYLDAPKGKGKSKVYPVRDVYHVNLPALRCS
jgi:hypothetical protein